MILFYPNEENSSAHFNYGFSFIENKKRKKKNYFIS